jgi:hypothetical protein
MKEERVDPPTFKYKLFFKWADVTVFGDYKKNQQKAFMDVCYKALLVVREKHNEWRRRRGRYGYGQYDDKDGSGKGGKKGKDGRRGMQPKGQGQAQGKGGSKSRLEDGPIPPAPEDWTLGLIPPPPPPRTGAEEPAPTPSWPDWSAGKGTYGKGADWSGGKGWSTQMGDFGQYQSYGGGFWDGWAGGWPSGWDGGKDTAAQAMQFQMEQSWETAAQQQEESYASVPGTTSNWMGRTQKPPSWG